METNPFADIDFGKPNTARAASAAGIGVTMPDTVTDQPAIGAAPPTQPMLLAQGDAMSNQERNAYFNATGERISGGGAAPVAQAETPSAIDPGDRPKGYISAPPPSNTSGLIQAKMRGGMTEAEARQWASERGFK